MAFCSTIRIVTPWSRRRISVWNTSCTRLGERPIDGSSIRMSFGSSSSARAISSCFCWPPESAIAGSFALLAQDRELVHHLFDPALHPALVLGGDAAELEVVQHREVRHDVAALRHVGDAVGDHLRRRLAR